MPPQITPIAGPVPITTNAPQSQSQLSARERAIARLTATPQQTAPVPNPSQISPEEMSAVKAPESTSGQTHSTEESVEAPQSAAPEAKPAETTEPAQTPLSAQYAQLARKERALQQQARELKAAQAAFKAAQEALKPAAPAMPQGKMISVEEFQKNPWAVAKANGVTYEQLTNQAMNEPSPEQAQLLSVIDELRTEIKSLKDDSANTKTQIQDSQTQSYNQAVNQIRQSAKQLVSSNPEFETIKATGAVDDVVDLITETFKKDGVLLTVEDAAAEVENYLVEEALKLSRLQKIQQRLKPAAPTPAADKQAPSNTQQPQMKTLTNSVSTQRQLSTRERAILAFKGELK